MKNDQSSKPYIVRGYFATFLYFDRCALLSGLLDNNRDPVCSNPRRSRIDLMSGKNRVDKSTVRPVKIADVCIDPNCAVEGVRRVSGMINMIRAE